jgi:WhiB family transcriptional regulator, redox-sensing transcriptional regulator
MAVIDAAVVEMAFVSKLAETEPDTLWTRHAACRGQTHLFFAPRAERPQARIRRESLARQVCSSCSVLATCRHTARELREYGFWGGESEEERHLLGFTVAAPIGVRVRPLNAS